MSRSGGICRAHDSCSIGSVVLISLESGRRSGCPSVDRGRFTSFEATVETPEAPKCRKNCVRYTWRNESALVFLKVDFDVPQFADTGVA